MSLLDRAGAERVRFASSFAHHGGRLAVATRTTVLTYERLEARVSAAADELGTTRRLVLVATSNDIDSLVGYLAALRGGHPAILVAGDRPANVDRLIERFDPDVVISGPDGGAVVERRLGSAHELHPDLALLLSTSGSTGASKLVRLSAANLQANAEAIADYLQLTPADRAMVTLPMHYCYGLSVLNSHLERGAGIVLSDLSVVDRCFWELFRAHGATGLSGVPYTFELLDRVGFDSMELPTLRYVTQAGGRLAPELVRRYAQLGARDGWELFVMYGQTEATARMAYLPPHLAATHPRAIGVPIPGGAFSIDPVAEVEDGGELVYRGPNVMLGYAETPEDLALGATAGELRTGDLARRDEAGLYEIIGRRSRFAKVLGLRLDLERIEALLGDHGIEALCASDDDRLLIGVTREADAHRARAAIRTECGVPPSRVEVIVLGAIPRLPSGKPDHAALRCAAPPTSPPPEPASDTDTVVDDEIDPVVRAVLTRLLQPADITPAATFVSLGGDSLSYVEASIALEEHLGALPPDWHTTPVAALRRDAPRPRFRARRTETTVVLRAIAIVLVVGTHIKLFNVLGGAHLLLAIGGYNFTRFQQRTSDAMRSIARIAVPSMVWLAVATTLNERIHLTHLLLLNGWIGGDDAHGGYWYVEAVVQILVPLAALLAIPAVRRAERRHQFAFPMALLTVGLLVRFHIIDLPTVEPHDIRPHDIAWIFALGWAAAQARTTTHRWLVSAAAVGAVPGYFGEPAREVLVVAGLLLIIWVRTIALPRIAVRVVGVVAAASLYTYLTHWQVFPPLDDRFGPVVALLGSLAAGSAAWSASRWLVRAVGRVAQVAMPVRGAASRSSPAPGAEPSMA